ncbi:MAG: C39 family peptidase [Herbaspirillum sp.]|nr:C39 family peptidase [Herbaspirillum sp.]
MNGNTVVRLIALGCVLNTDATCASDVTNSLNREKIVFEIPAGSIQIPIQSWKSRRDAQVVKQDRDYSCGAAALATLLNEFYGQSLSEEMLLDAMNKGDMRASFEDMQRALPRFGFKAQGFAATYEQLARLRVPVVVYLRYRKDDHFSVLRGIDEHTVWLADPSLGNRTYSKEQFLDMWETRQEKTSAELSGKFLAVVPNSTDQTTKTNFFTKEPVRQVAPAIAQLMFRYFR